MKTAGADNIGFLGVAASTLWGVVSGVYVVTTLIPSLIGAIMHTVNRARRDDLSPMDFVISMVGALLIGIWGGPWVAEIVPKTEQALPIMCYLSAYYAEQALPIMCYLSAYYATDFSKWIRKAIEDRFSGNNQNGNDDA